MRARQVTHREKVRSAPPLIDSSMARSGGLSRLLGSGLVGGGAGGKTERRERRGLWSIGLGPNNSIPRPKEPALQALSRCRWVHDKRLGFTSPPSRRSCYKVLASHTLAPPPHQLLFVLPQPPRRDQGASLSASPATSFR